MLNQLPLETVMDALTSRDDAIVRALEKLLAKMMFDDVLIWGRYRVEWLSLETGLKHFALYHDGQPEVIVDVRSDETLPDIRMRLASYMATLGFVPDKVDVLHYAAVALPQKKNRLPKLFEVIKLEDEEDDD